jgi:predicted transcriptional regulator
MFKEFVMVDENVTNELLNFFKTLADANRLKIVGVLAQQSATGEQLAEMLNLHPSTVSHHLGRLQKAGLVSARAEGYYNMYYLETKELENMSKRLLERETLPAISAEVDVDAFDRKVIKAFVTPDGKVKDFPAQQKKFEAILRYVVQAFEPGVRYSEKQVNEILLRYNKDTARLRRSLVETGLMGREGGGGEYWRIVKTDE